MKLEIRYFASLREALGPGEAIEVADGSDVGAVRDALIARSPAHARALARGRAVRAALDRTLCEETALPQPGAELAFFPPVTGG